MKRVAKNNNLDNYRVKMQEQNEALVKKAINHIQSFSGAVSFSSVSKVTYELSNIENGEQGLTVAGITKNPLYRALVQDAKADKNPMKGGKTRTKYSAGDMNLALHALRVENAKLKQNNKILTLKLKETPSLVQNVEPIRDDIIKTSNLLKSITKSIVNRLQELEVAYIDKENRSLVLSHFDEIIVPNEALKIFYKKELDEIKN